MNSDIKWMKKLQNKGTGETVEMRGIGTDEDGKLVFSYRKGNRIYFRDYNSLANFNEEWEDYEEPKGIQDVYDVKDFVCIKMGSKEEAEKTVEKLKACKRLKDCGFKFEGWKRDKKYWGDLTIEATDQISCDDKDLDLLFGGKE